MLAQASRVAERTIYARRSPIVPLFQDTHFEGPVPLPLASCPVFLFGFGNLRADYFAKLKQRPGESGNDKTPV